MNKYPPLAPYITVNDGATAVDFYRAAFGATERCRLTDPESGKIGHSELIINGELLMLSDEYPSHGMAPSTLGGHTGRLCLMVDDVDAALASAVEAGAEEMCPAEDHFYGMRSATVRDPFGHVWNLQKQQEELSPEEMQARWAAMLEK